MVLAVNNRLVDGESAVTRHVVGEALDHGMSRPDPLNPGVWLSWKHVERDPNEPSPPAPIPLRFDFSGKIVVVPELFTNEKNAIVRRRPDGGEKWRIASAHEVDPQSFVIDDFAVISNRREVLVVDDAKGKRRWSATLGVRTFAADASEVVAIRFGQSTEFGVIAWRRDTGQKVFEVPLPKGFLAQTLDVQPSRIVVTTERPMRNATVVLDRRGKVIHQVDGRLVGSYPTPSGVVVFTEKETALLGDDGSTVWSKEPVPSTFVGETNLIATEGGLLVGNFGLISDSGVYLELLDPTDGRAKWATRVPDLGTGHSKYAHLAYVLVKDGKVYVVSQGSHGNFFERVDLATGKRERRCSAPDGACHSP